MFKIVIVSGMEKTHIQPIYWINDLHLFINDDKYEIFSKYTTDRNKECNDAITNFLDSIKPVVGNFLIGRENVAINFKTNKTNLINKIQKECPKIRFVEHKYFDQINVTFSKII